MHLTDLTETERDRIATAFHEAGHAVVAVLAGGNVEEAVVYDKPREGLRGYTVHYDVPEHAERALTYSGPFCEARYMSGPHPSHRQIRDALRGTCDGDDLTAAAAGLPRHIEPTLNTAWRSVCALAAELYSRGRVEHADVLAALGVPADDSGAGLALVASMIKAGMPPTPTKLAESRVSILR